MTSVGIGLVLTAVLAAGFASVGELVLRRRSRRLVAWNESFLAGAAVVAAALFPLSLIFRRATLAVAMGALAAALVIVALRGVLRREPPRPRVPRAADPVSRALLVGIVVAAAAFVALDLRYNLFWDGLLIWGSKAQVLFHEGFLGRAWYPDDAYELRHLTYPPLVPVDEALLATLEGRFDFDALKPVFLPFFFSLPISTFAAVRAFGSRRLALAAVLMVVLVPPLVTGHSAGGFADMPEAAFVAAAVGAAFRRSDDGAAALPWLLGGLTTVKAEGTVLAATAALAVLGVWLVERASPTDRRRRWSGAAIVAGFLALRLAYVRWLNVPDPVYVPLDAAHLQEALARLPRVLHLCLVKTLSPRRWGLLWPGFVFGAAVLLLRGTRREKALAGFVATAAVVLALPFLFTTWPLEVQIDQAYPRLLEQVAPAAVVCLVVGLRRAADPDSIGDLDPARRSETP